jgi:hypothetical protein
MQRKTLLVAVALVAILASALLYFLLQPKTPSQQVTQPAVNATKPQQAQNATQPQPPAQNATQSQLPQPKPPLIIAAIETSGGGRILANGTDTATWNSTRPFVLVLEALPDKGYVLDHWLVNGTDAGGQLRLNLTVAGNTTATAVFKKVSFTARFLNITVPVRVNVTGRVYTSDFALGFNNSLAVEVAPYGADDAGCVPYNKTHKACLSGWLREPNETLWVRYLRVNLTGDEEFRQLVKLVKANYTAAIVEVWVGNTTVKTVAEPSKTMLVPFSAEYEMVGGWFHVRGDDWIFYVKMPPWRLLRVYVNYTSRIMEYKGGKLELPAIIALIVRNGPVYLDVGTYFYTVPTTVFTFNRSLVDLYARALEQCNFQRSCMEEFFDYEREFYRYVTCYNLAWDMACNPGKTAAGPGERLQPGSWAPGDLHIEGSGEMWIRIEIAG